MTVLLDAAGLRQGKCTRVYLCITDALLLLRNLQTIDQEVQATRQCPRFRDCCKEAFPLFFSFDVAD
jgi:hypothetical protein